MELVRQQASSKRRLKLGDIAELLQTKKFVIRSWEKELGLAPQSGFYGAEAIELFKKIKQLVLVDRQSLEQVRGVIGADKATASDAEEEVQDCAVVVEQAFVVESTSAAVVSYEAAHAAGEQIVEALELKAEISDDILEVAVVAAAVVSHDEEKVHVKPVLLDNIDESQSKHRYEAATEAAVFVQKHAIEPDSQQKFLTELAFFKQELLKFQQLLNV